MHSALRNLTSGWTLILAAVALGAAVAALNSGILVRACTVVLAGVIWGS